MTEVRSAVVCRDGFNGGATDGVVLTGTWRLDRPVTLDGDTVPDYYEEGWVEGGMGPPDAGECNRGLETTGDTGEWCDGWWNEGMHTCDTSGADGVPMSWEFADQNGDGAIDTGGFYYTFASKQTIRLAGHGYSFTAAGVALDRTTSVVIE